MYIYVCVYVCIQKVAQYQATIIKFTFAALGDIVFLWLHMCYPCSRKAIIILLGAFHLELRTLCRAGPNDTERF